MDDEWLQMTKENMNPEQKALVDQTVKQVFPPKSKNSFIFEEMKAEAKRVISISGDKGDGKTVELMRLQGKIAIINFDNKAPIIKQNMYANAENISVFDGTKYFNELPEAITETANVTIDYLNQLLDHLKDKGYDWVAFDSLESLSQLSEMAMRYRNGLKYSQGIPNPGVWKERKLIIRGLHRKALNAAKKGLVYTTYFLLDEEIKDGTVTNRKKVPKFADIVLEEVDIVIKVYSETIQGKKKFFREIISSKDDGMFKTGTVLDVTKEVKA